MKGRRIALWEKLKFVSEHKYLCRKAFLEVKDKVELKDNRNWTKALIDWVREGLHYSPASGDREILRVIHKAWKIHCKYA